MQRLTFIRNIDKSESIVNKYYKGKIALYKCTCGNETIQIIHSVNRGAKVSCGCIYGGKISHPNYRIWLKMKDRCYNPNHHLYHRYGGRGIKICDRWLQKDCGFNNFVEDMGVRPNNLSLDRINGDGNYEPGNCRWATMKEQQNNKYNNVILEYDNKKLNVQQWSELLGYPHHVILTRIRKKKWSAEKAITTPYLPSNKRKMP